MNAQTGENIEVLISPLRRTDLKFKVVFLLLFIATLVFLATIIYQQMEGHVVEGLGTEGAVWGFLVANIVNLIGISHVGIAISAFVRIMNLERYKQLARMAEMVTLVALTAAVLNIGLDLGRIDRFIPNVLWYGRWSSPFVWSMTVITAYFLLSFVYLYVSMRRDLALSAQLLPKRAWFYRFLALGYADTEEERKVHKRLSWWLAVLIIPIMVSVHSVYGLIFGLLSAQPGWYNQFMAPYFVLGAVVSGFAAMILVVAFIRKMFRWESIFKAEIFRGLGSFLGFMTLLYIYFMASEMITGMYASSGIEYRVFHDLLFGRFAFRFWFAFLGGLIIPFLLLFIQWVRKPAASIGLTVVCAMMISTGMWVVRALIVVPTFYHAHLPHYQVAEYFPTWVEWVLTLGLYTFAAMLYMLLCKIFPVLELPSSLRLETRPGITSSFSRFRMALLILTAAVGVGLIAAGIYYRDYVPASFIWVCGIVVLVTIPLQIAFRKVSRAGGLAPEAQ